ncbi:MAG: hypothetical protein M3096_09420 [Actinomycetia bacterium]|nr:hypothetical protein [Actinomycetes bacterium]
MWRKIILVGTVAVSLLGGAAIAIAAPPGPDAPRSESTVQLDHWSGMQIEMDDQQPALRDHMDATFGYRFPEMARAMELYGPLMHGSDMHEFMNEPGMNDFMGSPGMDDS